MSDDDLLGLVERIATRLTDRPRLAILDTVEEECERLGVRTHPNLTPFVGPAALRRLRIDTAC